MAQLTRTTHRLSCRLTWIQPGCPRRKITLRSIVARRPLLAVGILADTGVLKEPWGQTWATGHFGGLDPQKPAHHQGHVGLHPRAAFFSSRLSVAPIAPGATPARALGGMAMGAEPRSPRRGWEPVIASDARGAPPRIESSKYSDFVIGCASFGADRAPLDQWAGLSPRISRG
jgi:hypothetical protein